MGASDKIGLQSQPTDQAESRIDPRDQFDSIIPLNFDTSDNQGFGPLTDLETVFETFDNVLNGQVEYGELNNTWDTPVYVSNFPLPDDQCSKEQIFDAPFALNFDL